jgi:hypothetical protein
MKRWAADGARDVAPMRALQIGAGLVIPGNHDTLPR